MSTSVTNDQYKQGLNVPKTHTQTDPCSVHSVYTGASRWLRPCSCVITLPRHINSMSASAQYSQILPINRCGSEVWWYFNSAMQRQFKSCAIPRKQKQPQACFELCLEDCTKDQDPIPVSALLQWFWGSWRNTIVVKRRIRDLFLLEKDPFG